MLSQVKIKYFFFKIHINHSYHFCEVQDWKKTFSLNRITFPLKHIWQNHLVVCKCNFEGDRFAFLQLLSMFTALLNL